MPKGRGKSGREPSMALPSLSCFSQSALSACQLSYGREVVPIPHELEPEIIFKINNLQETACSLKSN